MVSDVIAPTEQTRLFPFSASAQAIYKAATYENKRYLNYFMSAQRLVGVTAEVIGKGQLKIRYETCYKGIYNYTLKIIMCCLRILY